MGRGRGRGHVKNTAPWVLLARFVAAFSANVCCRAVQSLQEALRAIALLLGLGKAVSRSLRNTPAGTVLPVP